MSIIAARKFTLTRTENFFMSLIVGMTALRYFSIDDESGELTALGHQLTEPTPRVFNIDETGNYLFVGGQGSGKLATYRINRESGLLSLIESYAVGKNPMWVLFV